MELFSFQILLINLIVAGIITSSIYIFNRKLRHLNPLLLFLVSSVGTFIGTFFAFLIPDFSFISNSLFIKNIVLYIPSILTSIICLFIWIKGSKTEGYF